MKLHNVQSSGIYIIEDYILEEGDPSITFRILSSPNNLSVGFLGYNNRYIPYRLFMKFVSDDFSKKVMSTFEISIEPEVKVGNRKEVTGEEVNHFIRLGCITMGKDRMLELIDNNKTEIEECLQKRP